MKVKVLDDGGTLHEVDAGTDVGGAILLLEYARARGFRLGPYLQVGSVTVQVADTRQENDRRDPDPIDPDFARVMNLTND